MVAYALRRIASSLLVLWLVVSITFFLTRLLPGSPFDREKGGAKVAEALAKQYQLDGSLWQQYQAYLRDLLHGDLRRSTKYRQWSASEILAQKLPVSLVLGGCALLLATTAGVGLGAACALRPGSRRDRWLMAATMLPNAIPTFVSGPLLIVVFALLLSWLPVGGWGQPAQIILPTLCLAAPFAAQLARLTRGSLHETLSQPYIRSARAKGLSPQAVLLRHALRPAMLPVVSYLGPLAANLLTGSMVIESIFSISGTGSVFVNSIQNRDVFPLCAAVLVYCSLLIFFNLLTDLVLVLLDRRIQLR